MITIHSHVMTASFINFAFLENRITLYMNNRRYIEPDVISTALVVRSHMHKPLQIVGQV